jgi:cation transport regulator ChaC
MHYFAYGANMDLLTLAERQIDYLTVGPGWLENSCLTFQMPGRDGTGKADIPPQIGSVVEGVIYRVPAASLLRLDVYEGLDFGHYTREFVQVRCAQGTLECIVYRALKVQSGLRPSDAYLARLLRGAQTHGLSEEYRRFLQGHETMPVAES